MLREILSITGKPGLYRLVSQGRNSLIVENLQTKQRGAALGRDKIVSLGDVAMYTTEEDMPLNKILDKVYEKFEGKPVDVKQMAADKALPPTFREILPDFDEDRVYDSDIKKLFQWYNILLEAGFTKFTTEESKEE